MLGEIVVCTSARNEQTSHGFSKQDSPREPVFSFHFATLSRVGARAGAECGSLVRVLTKEIE